MVFHTKEKSDETLNKYKTHLVTQGYLQTPSLDYIETFNLLFKMKFVHIILSIALFYGWHIRQ